MKHTPIIQEMYAAFGCGDIAAVLKRLHPEVLWAANVDRAIPAALAVPCYEPGRGHAFVAEYFQKLARGYDIHEFQILSFMEGGNEVAVRLRINFTIRPTGKRVSGEVIHHYILNDDGLVTRFLDIEDTLGFSHAWS